SSISTTSMPTSTSAWAAATRSGFCSWGTPGSSRASMRASSLASPPWRAVFGNDSPKASVVGEITFESDFYDYETKYTEGLAQLMIPASIPNPVAEKIKEMSLQAFAAVDAAGLARIDFFYLESTREVLINEINTLPGFTATSMYPQLWEATGVPFSKLVDQLIQLALERQEVQQSED
ncbi:MAG: hypothetical protein F6K10_30385, partial [Moorea sp. SIO2B7]|nr:hypothetical protein [Moorena sp. SIO2B7]